MFNKGCSVMYGTVAATSADNLGNCALGGFKEGSTAFRGCRQCMATVDEMKTQVCHYTFKVISFPFHVNLFLMCL